MREERKSAPLSVCVSGFGSQQQLKVYSNMVERMGGKFHSCLDHGVTVLAINSVKSQKYKVARLMLSPPHIVTGKWLTDSNQRGRFEDFAKYAVQDLFYGLRIGMYGYKQLELDILLKNFKGKENHFVEISSLQEGASQDLDVVVMNPAEHRRHHDPLDSTGPPIVCQEWLERSLQQGVCLWPEDYAYNRDRQHHTKSIEGLVWYNETHGAGMRNEVGNTECNILAGAFVWARDYGPRQLQRISHIVNALGGMLVPIFCDNVTHIIPHSFNEADWTNFTKLGDTVEVVRLAWLVDCAKIGTRLPCNDYRFRRNKYSPDQDYVANEKQDSAVKQPPSQDNANSIGFGTHSNGYNSEHLPSLSMRRSLSISFAEKERSALKSNSKYETTELFKGRNFYLLKEHEHREEMQRIYSKIRRNGGAIYDRVGRSLGRMYIVMADDPDNKSHMQQFARYADSAFMVSHRWIDYCISKKLFVDPSKSAYFIFKPFCMPTPLTELLKCEFVVLGFNDIMKERICELLEVVARRPKENCVSMVTHAVCEPDYRRYEERSRIYLQLQQHNKHVRYVKLNWITDSLNLGALQPLDKYLME